MEISNREELKRIIKSERSNYLSSKGWYQEFLKIVKSHPDYNVWLYTKQLRRTSCWRMVSTKLTCSVISKQ